MREPVVALVGISDAISIPLIAALNASILGNLVLLVKGKVCTQGFTPAMKEVKTYKFLMDVLGEVFSSYRRKRVPTQRR